MIGKAIEEALDPTKAPGKCVSLKDMPPEKQAELLALYSKPAPKEEEEKK